MVTGSLGEGAGGLASAVRAWSEALAEAGVQITVFCLDLTATFGPNLIPRHPRIRTIEIPCLIEPRSRLILALRLQGRLKRHCAEHDVDLIHAHGVWLPGTRIAARVAQRYGLPFIVSPHGHLQPWAMAHKRLKKWLAWNAYGRGSLAGANLVQAASVSEREGLRALGVQSPVALVPNIVAAPADQSSGISAQNRSRTALFLSRIHPSKGLLDLVEAWNALRPEGWRVVVAGPDEVGHLAEVQDAVSRHKLEDGFEFVGAVPYEDRWRWYWAADLYVLPTYSENFGVTVAEALSAGVPVITTHAAPWSALVQQGCGWWVDTGPDALRDALSEATAMDDVVRARMGECGRALVSSCYSASVVARRLLDVYLWACSKGGRPACVEIESV